jgi:type II restriction/modification system DNA methylase subunit YeeA
VLEDLNAIECRDALVAKRENGSYEEAKWPEAEFIVGNPPFLGDRRMIAALGEVYVERLRAIYESRLPGHSDLVCYWFSKGLHQLKRGNTTRVGFVATNSISGGNNIEVLKQITSDGRIFEAWSDEGWVVEGADVRVALVLFSGPAGNDEARLDGRPVDRINADLTSGASLVQVRRLVDNNNTSFIGDQKNGPFDVPGEVARKWIQLPNNPNGASNKEVVRPWTNGSSIVRGDEDKWIIDFGTNMAERDAAFFEVPFEHVVEYVKPTRINLRRQWHRTKWWLHGDPRPAMRRRFIGLSRIILTPRVAKYRLFVWRLVEVLPDSAVVAIARDDDATFGILHSRFHETWSLRLGTWLGVGNDPRYTPTTTFETFPFPEGLTPNIPASVYADNPHAIAIAAAAKRLDELRNAWLNPPDLIDVVPEVVPGYPDRILPKNEEAAAILKKRTLTNLYNARPQWLGDAHRDLDAAVAAAYGWPADISEEDALAKLLELNLSRAGVEAAPARDKDEDGDEDAPEQIKAPRLTREEFARISEVEGLRLSDPMKQAFADFDRRGLSPEERRQAIIDRFKQTAK